MLLALAIKSKNGDSHGPLKKAPKNHAHVKLKERVKQDVMFLKTLNGSQEKNPYKRHLIEKYKPDVELFLSTHRDLGRLDIVWYWFMWSCDLGHLDDVYLAFKDAIDRHLTTPNDWKSTAQTAFADIIFKHELVEFELGTPSNHKYLFDLIEEIEQGNYAINLALKSKIYRLAGDVCERLGDDKKALIYFEKLMLIDGRGGRKAKIAELKEKLSK